LVSCEDHRFVSDPCVAVAARSSIDGTARRVFVDRKVIFGLLFAAEAVIGHGLSRSRSVEEAEIALHGISDRATYQFPGITVAGAIPVIARPRARLTLRGRVPKREHLVGSDSIGGIEKYGCIGCGPVRQAENDVGLGSGDPHIG